MNIRQLLRQTTEQLKQAGCKAPRLDAELLLMFVWHINRTDLIIRSHDEVSAAVENNFNILVKRRARREPLAYITGEKEFWSRPFAVTPDVLIPRPETEHLVEAVLEHFPNKNGSYHFCDIGTGSGCIAVTLACEYPQARIVATDISGAALDIARRNAENHGAGGRITFRQGDMLEALLENDALFHAIISNPPYVAEHEMNGLEQELAQEPRCALTDEQDGLKYLTVLLHNAPTYLHTGGYIILETGLCGLPETPANLRYQQPIHDLAGHLRGGIYHLPCI
ncbi:MAG: peptide chain release factor N(5)-glutamine methyltransferase [Mariprofundus sp.]|nr:peptide chain release factor N(5)-glutamine methyltransferase [Mariprofundus sp.]